MTLQVPYMSDGSIEREAGSLLAEFAHARGVQIQPPIPIDDIVEKHLKLHVEFDDLHRRLGVPRGGFGNEPDIFGAIWLEAGEIVLDESLDPDVRPRIEGRYRFTLAHEGGGHWRLHRRLVQANNGQGSLFGYARQPTVVCRSSQSKERVELQANLYASCLLMPRRLVTEAWRDRFGSDHPRMLRRTTGIIVPSDFDEPTATLVRSVDQSRDDEVLEHFARPFAERFMVSPIAMRIRLERLGLVQREVPRQRSLALVS